MILRPTADISATFEVTTDPDFNHYSAVAQLVVQPTGPSLLSYIQSSSYSSDPTIGIDDFELDTATITDNVRTVIIWAYLKTSRTEYFKAGISTDGTTWQTKTVDPYTSDFVIDDDSDFLTISSPYWTDSFGNTAHWVMPLKKQSTGSWSNEDHDVLVTLIKQADGSYKLRAESQVSGPRFLEYTGSSLISLFTLTDSEIEPDWSYSTEQTITFSPPVRWYKISFDVNYTQTDIDNLKLRVVSLAPSEETVTVYATYVEISPYTDVSDTLDFVDEVRSSRGISSALSITSTVEINQLIRSRNSLDSVIINSTAQPKLLLNVDVEDSLSIVDEARFGAPPIFKNLSDSITISDSISTRAPIYITISDSVAIGESEDENLLIENVLDILIIQESLNESLKIGFASDSIFIIDTPNSSLKIPPPILDVLALQDSFKSNQYYNILNDQLGGILESTQSWNTRLKIIDFFTISDHATARYSNWRAIFSDTLTLSESLLQWNMNPKVVDTLQITDSTHRVFPISIEDTVNLFDIIAFPKDLQDILTINYTLNAIKSKPLSDSISIIQILCTSINSGQNIVDTLQLSDFASGYIFDTNQGTVPIDTNPNPSFTATYRKAIASFIIINEFIKVEGGQPIGCVISE